MTGDCAAKEGWGGGRRFNDKSQQTLWSKKPRSGNMSLLLPRHAGFTEILAEQRDGKGERGEQASREQEGGREKKNAGMKWIKKC